MDMKRNDFGIGYFTVKGALFKEKMSSERIFCDDCNAFIEEHQDVVVIPFLNSAYCPDCATFLLKDCEAIELYEEIHQVNKEKWYTDQFK